MTLILHFLEAEIFCNFHHLKCVVRPAKKTLIGIGITTLHSNLFDRIIWNVIDQEHITSIVAKCSIFDHIPNIHYMVRALCAAILGNDTNPGGIKGVCPLLLANTINDIYKI